MPKNSAISKEVKNYINEKLEVLEELYIFGPKGAKIAKKKFIDAIKAAPNRDPYIVIDQLSRTMIMRKG